MADDSSITDKIRLSPPIDLSLPYNAAWVKGKTILITGGASGFGAGFVRNWALKGATIIVGDVNVELGDRLARELRAETGSSNVHFVYCDVTNWQSQVNLFKEAVKLSPHGGIDTVVANAGISGKNDVLERPKNMDVPEPQKPDFKVVDVNLTGVLYTTHLAYHYLPRNPGSKPARPDFDPASSPRDRHLLLIGSVASFCPIVTLPQYAISKHAVLGLFRTIRGTAFLQGIRVSLVCPYFIDTPILNGGGRLILAGGATGKVEDVVDAATRLVADTRIVGRSLFVGPKVWAKDEGGYIKLAQQAEEGALERAIWEPYAEDWEQTEVFTRRMIALLNAVERARGWVGWARDIVGAVWTRSRE